VALALLIAESDPRQKELMIRLIMNLLAGYTEYPDPFPFWFSLRMSNIK